MKCEIFISLPSQLPPPSPPPPPPPELATPFYLLLFSVNIFKLLLNIEVL